MKEKVPIYRNIRMPPLPPLTEITATRQFSSIDVTPQRNLSLFVYDRKLFSTILAQDFAKSFRSLEAARSPIFHKRIKSAIMQHNMSFFKPGFHSVYYIGTMPRFVTEWKPVFWIIHCISNIPMKYVCVAYL